MRGVGLSIVRTLVERHGGSVAVRSNGPGQGAEFEVRLPLAAHGNRVAAPGDRDAPHAQDRAFRALLIEDNRDAREALRTVSIARSLVPLGHRLEQPIDRGSREVDDLARGEDEPAVPDQQDRRGQPGRPLLDHDPGSVHTSRPPTIRSRRRRSERRGDRS